MVVGRFENVLSVVGRFENVLRFMRKYSMTDILPRLPPWEKLK